ncbi:MAG: GspH/FimT family pseudopilin [Nitrospirae bacterium]|nr:GspH/FimT family pseudopilin [Nitrospirota bacterium]
MHFNATGRDPTYTLPFLFISGAVPMSPKGFTLIELVIVLALVGVLTALAVPNLSGLETRLRLQAACRELAGDLRTARQMALFKQADLTVEFDSPNRRYRLPWGEKTLPLRIRFGYPPEVQGPPSNPKPLDEPDGISFPGNRAAFNADGRNSTGTLYLTNDQGETRALTLVTTGRVRLWRWQGGNWK